MTVNVSQFNSALTQITIDELSLCGYYEILRRGRILRAERKLLAGHYAWPGGEQDNYAQICKAFSDLHGGTEQDAFLTFGRLTHCIFVLLTVELSNFVNILALVDNAELNILAKALATNLNLPEPKLQPTAIPACNNILSKEKNQELIDADEAFENKLIFYWLYNQKTDDFSKISDEVSLLSMENKEKILEQIIGSSAKKFLPNAIQEHIFCSIKINAPFYEISPLLDAFPANIHLAPLTCLRGADEQPALAGTSLQALYLTALELAKNHFKNSGNVCALPFACRQGAIVSVNLRVFNALNKSAWPAASALLALINKQFPFFGIQ